MIRSPRPRRVAGAGAPAVDHRELRPTVAHPDCEVQVAVRERDRGAMARHRDPLAVAERHGSSGSSLRDGTSSGRNPDRSDISATRAARFADFTEPNVATARTRVPPAVANDEIVTQSATAPMLFASSDGHRPIATVWQPTCSQPTNPINNGKGAP